MTGRDPEDGDRKDDTAARRRRREQVFGDVLPEATSDDRDEGREERGNEEWLRSNVPPHHG